MKLNNILYEGSGCEAGSIVNADSATDDNKPSPVDVSDAKYYCEAGLAQ